MRLPVELQSLILQHLDDTTSLLRCTLVCRAWTLHSRRTYFRLATCKVICQWPRNLRYYQHRPAYNSDEAFLEILQHKNSTFATTITQLEVCYQLSTPPNEFIARLVRSSVCLAELVLNEYLGIINPLNPRKRPLKAVVYSFPPQLLASLRRLVLRCQSMEYGAVATLLSNTPSLRFLCLTLPVVPAGEDITISVEPPISLTELQLTGDERVMSSFLHWVGSTSKIALIALKVKSWVHEPWTDPYFLNDFLCSSTASRLECLTIECQWSYRDCE